MPSVSFTADQLATFHKIVGTELTSIWIDEVAEALVNNTEESQAVGKVALKMLETSQEATKLLNARSRLTSVLSNVAAQKQFLIERPEWGTW